MRATKKYGIQFVTLFLVFVIVWGAINTNQQDESVGFKTLSGISSSDKVTYKLKCELPEHRETIMGLRFTTIPITEDELKYVATNFGNLKNVKEIVPWKHNETHVEGTQYLMRFKGKNNFLSLKIDKNSLRNTWSEEETVNAANSKVKDILEFLPVNTCSLTLLGSTLGSETIENGESIVHTINVIYGFDYSGVPITGNGGIISLSMCNGEVIEVEVHVPYVTETELILSLISPETALSAFLETKKVSTIELNKYGPDAEIEVSIEYINLVYYYNFLTDLEGDCDVCYQFGGRELVVSKSGETLHEKSYAKYIPATN